MRIAAIQLQATLGDVERNLAECERLIGQASDQGAELVALPEFFTTGMAFLPALADAALPPDGAATERLTALSRERRIWIGGSFLCRDDDGEVRNAYLLATPEGEIAGRHDKDLPTMWENSFYIGGDDDGVIDVGPFTAGAAVCWEFMRSQTARRLRGRVDLVVGGSNWWSVPSWRPSSLFREMERRNAATALRAPAHFARLVGAPVAHGAICGPIDCQMPDFPRTRYRGHLEGGAMVVDAEGKVLALRRREQGSSIAIAGVEVARVPPAAEIPDRYWLHRRGPVPTIAWHTQRAHGRRWYASNVRRSVGTAPPGSGATTSADKA